MNHPKTFRLDKLYHQFLKPAGLPIDALPELATRLYEAGFIDLFRDRNNPELERYAETPKLTERLARDELFKLIGRLKP